MTMTRRLLILILFVIGGCARKDNPLKDALPIQVQREWVLKETRTMPNEEAPEVVKAQNLKRWMIATYRTSGTITVRVFQMSAETSAFELMQKWRKTEGLVFYKGPYFIVVDSADTSKTMLAEFAQELQSSFKI